MLTPNLIFGVRTDPERNDVSAPREGEIIPVMQTEPSRRNLAVCGSRRYRSVDGPLRWAEHSDVLVDVKVLGEYLLRVGVRRLSDGCYGG